MKLAFVVVTVVFVALIGAIPMPLESVQPEQKPQEKQPNEIDEAHQNQPPKEHIDQLKSIVLPPGTIEEGENKNRTKRFILLEVYPAPPSYTRVYTYTVPAHSRVETTYIVV